MRPENWRLQTARCRAIPQVWVAEGEQPFEVCALPMHNRACNSTPSADSTTRAGLEVSRRELHHVERWEGVTQTTPSGSTSDSKPG